MKIFYGVQGTGNGHIARARMMAKAFEESKIEVTYQFTGRHFEQYFDMDVFGNYQLKTGLTFNTHKGKVNYLKTAFDAKIGQFFHDVKQLNLRNYDLVITDFEPVCAWAAQKQKKLTLGLGNQYAYEYNIPRDGADWISEKIMKHFAPVNKSIGLHWHHFGQPILPPIVATPEMPHEIIKNKIIVYLPFEDIEDVVKLLGSFEQFEFHVSTPHNIQSTFKHITFHPMACQQFQRDFYDCAGVLCNAGFAMVSEALQLGKKILIKPLHAQMEQTSNAVALKQLGYAHVMNDLNDDVLEHWLYDENSIRVTYPDTAKILVDWIQSGMPELDEDFIEDVWNKVDILHIKH